MVKDKTIFQREIEKNPEITQGDLEKLNWAYQARLSTLIAKTCEFQEGNNFKECFKQNSKLASEIYSLEDFFSDNFKLRDNENTLNKSIEILQKIFNQK